MEKISIPHYYLSIRGDTLFKCNLAGSSAESEVEFPLEAVFQNKQNQKIALIDRDGVIVEKAPRLQYLQRAEDMRLIPGITEAIHYLNEKRVLVVLVTNQPGIYKSLFRKEDFYEMTSFMQKSLEGEGNGEGKCKAKIDAVFFCPHMAPSEGDKISKDEECLCRKPKPGMLTAAMKLYCIKPENAVMFGDFASDIGAAHHAGVTAAYIATKHDEFAVMQGKIQEEYPEVFEKRQYQHILDAVKALF